MFNKLGTLFRLAALCAPVALAGCTDGGSAAAPRAHGHDDLISDQLHSGGTQGFIFLPPMVPRPATEGENVWGIVPTVRIDEICPAGSTTCTPGTTLRTLAQFTATSGPHNEHIRTHEHGHDCDRDDDDHDDDDDDYYYARWDTDDAHLSLTALYRVRVFIPAVGGGTRELGFADVDVVRSDREFRSVDTQNFAPLVNGSKLRIKFRLERPAVDGDGDGVFDWVDNCATVSNRTQLDTDHDGKGDSCECLGVTCAASDSCHVAGTCASTTGACSNPRASNGVACPLTNASAACSSGVCGITSCNAHFANCDTRVDNGCETLTTSLSNCGGCNVACSSGANSTPTCATGICALTCATGYADGNHSLADGCEINTRTDVRNCGSVGNACAARAGASVACVAGGCVYTCNAGLADCDGSAANGCEQNVATDVSHCGRCTTACGGDQLCTAGACTNLTCAVGRADCDHLSVNLCEVNSASDVNNCGGCGHACSFSNAAASCSASTCVMGACAPGFADVNGGSDDGCEVNTQTDPSHCGAGLLVCPTRANASTYCSGGHCGYACAAGYTDLNGDATDGCEINNQTDPSHCGAGLVNCALGLTANATATCTAGACGSFCNASFHACGAACASNGDVASCGASSCAPCAAQPNAAATCDGVACGFACLAGYLDCDGAAAGCETSTLDVNNCGSCHNVCPSGPHSTPTCGAGGCGIACAPGFTDCNGDPGDGCEAALATDALNCGTCRSVCPVAAGASAATCSAGHCGVVCAAGRGNCDNDASNGCETDVTTASDCGVCANACSFPNAVPACSTTLAGTACGFSACNMGYGDCDANQTNGCEVALNTTSNCGGCGVACHVANGTAACTAGACVVASCNAGYASNGTTCVDIDECHPTASSCFWDVGAQSGIRESAHAGANPAGAWSYFYQPGSSGTFAEYAAGTPTLFSAAEHTTAAGWIGVSTMQGYMHNIADAAPAAVVYIGPTGGHPYWPALVANNDFIYHPGALGSAGRNNTVRWTAPFAGTFSVSASWRAVGGSYTGVSFAAFRNHALPELTSGITVGTMLDPSAPASTYAGTLSLTAGETLDFVVGFTTGYGSGSTGLTVRIRRTDGGCPGTCADANGNGVCDDYEVTPPTPSGPCTGSNTTCVNTPGSYRCDCNAGSADCNGSIADGCEVSLNTAANCGGCGVACSTPNGASACVSGGCAVAACNAGFADCDHVATNGCEVSVSGDNNNCGACGNTCASGATCLSGVCANPCSPNPCLNGGTCAASGATYTCACTAGFTGINCQTASGCTPTPSTVTAGQCGSAGSKCFFQTSCTYTAAQVGGLANADTICQAHATAAGLLGTFRSLLSTSSVSAASRLTHVAVPYRTVTNVTMATNWNNLSVGTFLPGVVPNGEPDHTQTGVRVPDFVWTGTDPGWVSRPDDCGGWTSTSGSAAVGVSAYTDGRYLSYEEFYTVSCSTMAHIYCVEQ